jgi:ATP-binding cassette subfamily F protein 3
MRYGDRVILRDVSFRLAAGDRVGLVGDNGTGKTTLLRLALGQEEPTEGKVDVTGGVQLGYFSQFSDLHAASSIQTILEGLFADIREVEAELEAIGGKFETVTDDGEMEKLLERQTHLLEEMDRRDGWEYPRHIDTALTKLGFNERRRSQPIDELSGGWRNRAALAKILLEAPDVLLLDEPTNFLDVEGLAWLEQWVKSFRGGLLLVSHDRQFLDAVVSRVVELENHRIEDYPGNYTNYVQTKPFRIKNQSRAFEFEEELLLMEAESAADRQELAKSPSEQTRRKLADIKKRRPPRPTENIITDIYQGLKAPDLLVDVQEISKAYGDEALFSDVSFHVGRGERVAIVGPNGIGKSTLLKIVTGAESADSGTVQWQKGSGFVDFNAIAAAVDPKDTVIHAINVFGLGLAATRKQVYRFLTLLRFSEAEMQQRISTLSGGQRARVALAKCLLSGEPMLILDEPTNHLDLSSVQVMEQALMLFPGSVLLVSHDRFFLDKVATRLIVFEDGVARDFDGNWTMLDGEKV